MSYWYLATPYSKYPAGQEAAFKLACENAALLMMHGIPVFSPIAHTHPIAIYGQIDLLDSNFWLIADRPLMTAAKGLIMLQATSWRESAGMQIEFEEFSSWKKPVVWMMPYEVPPKFITTSRAKPAC